MRLSALRSLVSPLGRATAGLRRKASRAAGRCFAAPGSSRSWDRSRLCWCSSRLPGSARYGWAIHKLNRGVGDTVFLDARGREWFRLDEQRRDVPLAQISTYLKDAVIAVEDHRYYQPSGNRSDRRRARDGHEPAIGPHAGWQHHHAAARPNAVSLERQDAGAQGQGGCAGGDARGAAQQARDPRALSQPCVPGRRHLRRRDDVAEDAPQAGC